MKNIFVAFICMIFFAAAVPASAQSSLINFKKIDLKRVNHKRVNASDSPVQQTSFENQNRRQQEEIPSTLISPSQIPDTKPVQKAAQTAKQPLGYDEDREYTLERPANVANRQKNNARHVKPPTAAEAQVYAYNPPPTIGVPQRVPDVEPRFVVADFPEEQSSSVLSGSVDRLKGTIMQTYINPVLRALSSGLSMSSGPSELDRIYRLVDTQQNQPLKQKSSGFANYITDNIFSGINSISNSSPNSSAMKLDNSYPAGFMDNLPIPFINSQSASKAYKEMESRTGR